MKKVLIVFIILSIIGLSGIFLAFKENVPQTSDTVTINDAVMTVIQSEDNGEAVNFLTEQLNKVFENMDASRRSRDKNLQIFLYF